MEVSTTPWRLTAAPAGVDGPDGWALVGNEAMSRAVDVAHFGDDDLAYTLDDVTTFLSSQEYSTRSLLVATDGTLTGSPRPDDVLGSVSISLPRADNTHLASFEVRVHPDHRRRGVGSALLAEAERVATDAGRTTWLAMTDHVPEPPADDPDAVVAPTGSGRIRRTDPTATFFDHRGYVFEQAERCSVLDLPLDPERLAALRDDAAARAGSGYRTVAWQDAAPDRWVDQLAILFTRMSTDVPAADLDLDEEAWDAARVRASEAELVARGNRAVVVAAEHVPTGTLAAFTKVELPSSKPRVVYQDDTLVLREHRGRRLGMLVKTAMLDLLRELRPHAGAVYTWNAEENGHMLAINTALGFRPLGVTAAWQKRVATH